MAQKISFLISFVAYIIKKTSLKKHKATGQSMQLIETLHNHLYLRLLLLYDGKYLIEYSYKLMKENQRFNFYKMTLYKSVLAACYSLKFSVRFQLFRWI